MKKYSRVSYEVRCQISAYLQANFSVIEIAQKTGFHKSTIYREIKRNSGNIYYLPNHAEKLTKLRSLSRRKEFVLKCSFEKILIEKLESYWSPEQIVGRLRKEGLETPCIETIYKYLRTKPALKKYTRFMMKTGLGRLKQRKNATQARTSIHQRPSIINKRKRKGDWERDGMYGANRKQLLVCTDRKTRYTKLALIKDPSSNGINELTLKLLEETGYPIKSITNDNGSEFRKPIKKDIPVYFCDAYKPQQRGTVENMIGTLRKQIKRKTDLFELGDKKIKEIETIFNLTPRKGLDYKTPYEVFFNRKVALANRI